MKTLLPFWLPCRKRIGRKTASVFLAINANTDIQNNERDTKKKKKKEIPKKSTKKNQHALPEPTDIVGVNAHTAAGIRIVLRKGREGQHL